MKQLKSHKSFGGLTEFWEHDSTETGTPMKFSTFTPPGETKGCLIWLSGLSCTEENFISKAGAPRVLSELGMMVICPDTSPRGLNLPGEHDDWDFGSSAGFYVDATTPGWSKHYRMCSYVKRDIYGVAEKHFKMAGRISISGHSMGGHGALVLGLREPTQFRSVSAFAPIVNPTQVPWGHKAFNGYLGADAQSWKAYDACELVQTGHKHPHRILIDQGTADNFLETQLRPENFVKACEGRQAVELRRQEGYDHGYYFVASFIEDHLRFHAEAING